MSACKCKHSSPYCIDLNLFVRFVDRDMFMRYTHFGVGHSPLLRKITRDCSESVARTDAMDTSNSSNDEDVNHEVVGDGEDYDEFDDDRENIDEECDDESSDGESSDGELLDDNASEGYEGDEFDGISF